MPADSEGPADDNRQASEESSYANEPTGTDSRTRGGERTDCEQRQAAVLFIIGALALTRMPFTSHDVRAKLKGWPPRHPKSLRVAFMTAQREGTIGEVRFGTSTSRSGDCGDLRDWVGTDISLGRAA